MEPALAVFRPDTTVAEATRELRHFVTRAFITYVFVVDDKERLRGVVAMREMLLARPEQRLDEIMIARSVLSHAGDAARRGDEGDHGAPLSGLSGLQRTTGN